MKDVECSRFRWRNLEFPASGPPLDVVKCRLEGFMTSFYGDVSRDGDVIRIASMSNLVRNLEHDVRGIEEEQKWANRRTLRDPRNSSPRYREIPPQSYLEGAVGEEAGEPATKSIRNSEGGKFSN